MLFPSLLLLLAVACQSSLATADDKLTPAWKKVPRHVLHAASNRRRLAERDPRFHLINSTDLHYGGAPAGSDGSETAVMTVHIESQKPFLVLEDNENLFEQVSCQGPMMRLKFVSEEIFEESKDNLRSLVGSHVVSSHDGCNSDGARDVYR